MQSLSTTSPDGDTHWFAQAEAVEQLLGPQGLRLNEWERSGRLETVKSGAHRTVYRVRLDAGCYYLKHYRVGDWKALLQNAIRPPRAILEWRAAQRVAAAGVATIEILAVGRTVRRGLTYDSFLATRDIESTQSLAALVSQLSQFPATRRGTIRRNLAESMGRLAAALHRGGILHRDLHAENVLVRVEPDDSVRLWLVDLHAVDVCRRLTLRRIERNLALLNPALVHDLTRIDRARFFRSYWRALLSPWEGEGAPPDGWSAEPLKASLRQLASTPAGSAAKRLAAYCRRDLIRVGRKRDRKWSRGNRRLIIADEGNIRCRGLALLGREQLLAIRDDPGSLLGGGRPELGKTEDGGWKMEDGRSQRPSFHPPFSILHSPSSLPAASALPSVVSLTLDGCEAECRVQAIESPARSWRRKWAQAEVRRAWEMGHAFLRRKIPAARPLAFVEIDCGASSRQYLVTESIPHAVRLDRLLQSELPALGENMRERRIAQIGRRLAGELRCMHDCGFDHRSLGPASILVHRGHFEDQVWFASLEDVCQRRRLGQRHVVDALAGLNSGLLSCTGIRQTHRLRFLKHYLQERFALQWKATWRQVRQRTTTPHGVDDAGPPVRTDLDAIDRATLCRSA